MKLAFIASKFPSYDEAFILREIYALSGMMDVRIFSLRRSTDKVLHDEARELSSKTVYLPYFSWKLISAQFEMFLKHSVRYVRALSELVTGNWGNGEFLLKNLVFFPKAVYLAKLLKEEKVDHIHACWATYPASVALVASELTGIPFSFTGHAHDIYLSTTHLREKIRQAVFVSTCTKYNKGFLEKIAPGGMGAKIFVDHHGLKLDQLAAAEIKNNEAFEILSVGTLHYYKGFNYLLDALGVLKEKKLPFHCTIVGGGPLEGDLRKHVRMLKLETSVTMTGALKQTEVIPYYKKADILVLMAQPEWHWGIPNVLPEALAAHTAVITTRFGSVEELVREGQTGFLVPPKDHRALADKMEKLYRDPDLRRRLAGAGHAEVVKYFDLRKNILIFKERLTGEKTASTVA
jgi:colanic acid/amylovoran biosynthesis glycosyltransferase